MSAIEIEICDMRAAGKPGYVAKIGQNREKIFLNAKCYSAHKTSAKKVLYEITQDGIYEVCDANFGWRKRRVNFLLIRNDEIAFESESLSEVERKENFLNGKEEEWAVMPEEDLGIRGSDRRVDVPIPTPVSAVSLPSELVRDCDVEIKAFEREGQKWLRVFNRSDAGFRFFMPAMKLRVNGRKYNDSGKCWDIPPNSVMLLRELIEEYTIRTNGIRMQLEINISPTAKNVMAME